MRCRCLLLASLFVPLAPAQERTPRRPNVLLIVADDLGYGELGCYGQTRIKTPVLDTLASQGQRFAQFYSGAPVCAPSRCVLLTGRHSGHAVIRDNREEKDHDGVHGGQPALPPSTPTLSAQLRKSGYATACVGKWGLGGPGTEGSPDHHGFDYFFGYLCQRHAHDYYPDYIWKDGEKIALPDNPKDAHGGGSYVPDLMLEEALTFLRRGHAEEPDVPFLLCYTTPAPHLALQVPEDSLRAYAGAFEETPYDGKKGYRPHPTPRACYAAMISRLDRDVGRLLDELQKLGVADDTLVIFSSDNGATYTGGADTTFFQSNGALRGRKGDVWEGGLRVPMLARWPGKIPPGKVVDTPAAFCDLAPTILDLCGVTPIESDGVSLAPLLLSTGPLPERPPLYWELPTYGGEQAVRFGDWKAVRVGLVKNPDAPVQLFDLANDPGETTDVAAQHPEIARQGAELLRSSRTKSELFPFPALDR
ncbi:MAG: arylsulfatase [Planctomycetes bacterium]|nr:arylsulfatase [Planctomycetota bacterium]